MTSSTTQPRKAWTPEDVKLAFHLYCQLPYGRLHRSNPEIIALANLMGRSASAAQHSRLVKLRSAPPTPVAEYKTLPTQSRGRTVTVSWPLAAVAISDGSNRYFHPKNHFHIGISRY